jgi:hypothetical protein
MSTPSIVDRSKLRDSTPSMTQYDELFSRSMLATTTAASVVRAWFREQQCQANSNDYASPRVITVEAVPHTVVGIAGLCIAVSLLATTLGRDWQSLAGTHEVSMCYRASPIYHQYMHNKLKKKKQFFYIQNEKSRFSRKYMEERGGSFF